MSFWKFLATALVTTEFEQGVMSIFLLTTIWKEIRTFQPFNRAVGLFHFFSTRYLIVLHFH